MSTGTKFTPSRAWIAPTLAALLLAGLVLAVLQAQPATARMATVIGGERPGTTPTCPRKACPATGRVSGFQMSVGKHRGVFKVPFDGRLVAWSIELAKPDRYSRNFFEENLRWKRFEGHPYARIGVIRRVKKGRARFKLTKQTPAVRLDSRLGRTPIYTLGKPLRVKKGRILALSVPTWATNFSVGGGSRTVWRASRKSDKCDQSGPNQEENRKASKAHMRVGTTKQYGCKYSGERLLYTGYVVPDQKK